MTISPLVIFFASIFTSNMIFSNFLGMCSFIAVSKEIETATGLGIAVTFVLTITTIINFFLYKLVVRFNIEYLRYIIFIISIAAFVQLLEMILEKYIPNILATYHSKLCDFRCKFVHGNQKLQLLANSWICNRKWTWLDASNCINGRD